MDAIQTARELGKAIQQDERYITMMLAQQKSDEDEGLQSLIAKFNGTRSELNTLLQGEERDNDRITALDSDLKRMYQEIFQNENMARYTQARGEMEQMMQFVNQIVTGSASGEDPETIEFQQSCGGDCGGCSGCS